MAAADYSCPHCGHPHLPRMEAPEPVAPRERRPVRTLLGILVALVIVAMLVWVVGTFPRSTPRITP